MARVSEDRVATPPPAPRYGRYPEYRDSGVEWLGKVPVHWDVKRLGAMGRITKCSGGTKAHEAAEGIPCVRYGDLYTYHGSSIADTRSFVSPEHSGSYSRIRHGDVLFAASGETVEEIGKSSVNLLGGEAVCGGDVILLRPTIPVSARFLGYATNAPYVVHQKSRLGRGMTVVHIYGKQLKDVAMLLPPVPEQRDIVEFLDRQLDKIDAVIERHVMLIELLQEKRNVLSTCAVTRGLNPNDPMRESGVEWLGKIPTHWEVKRVKWLARMESGHTPDKKVEAYWADGDVPWVSLNDTRRLKKRDYIRETEYYTNELGLRNSSARLLPPRAVIFSRDATIGLCAITQRSMAVSQHFIAWICSDSLLPEYLLRVFDAMQGELVRLTMGATLRTIGMPDVRTLTTPIPPVSEQERIVAFVRSETAAIDGLIAKAGQVINRLEELRAALISAAVTGKIDVREVAA